MKTFLFRPLASAGVAMLFASAHAAPIPLVERMVCAGDASGNPDTPCFILPGIASFTLLGDLLSDNASEPDLSDFVQFGGLIANTLYDYSFFNPGERGFGFTYDADAIREVFDASNPLGSALSDAGGNIYAGFFLEDGTEKDAQYSLTLNAVPAPATAALLSLGLVIGAARRRRH
jgi:hypothetical protein